MDRRFDFMLDDRHSDFHPIFMMATVLDPYFKIFVSPLRQQTCRSHLI